MTRPLVSILTPSFNQARWLPDNLRSVAGQTYPSIEHVVMDGGSTDGSVEILAAAAPSPTWESRADRGQSHAINAAFDRSRGEVIGWLNSDDAYYSADVVEKVVAIFEDNPSIGLVYGHGALVNASGSLLYVLWAPPYSRRLLRLYNFISQPTAFVRRSAITRASFVDASFDYMMDRELWLHLCDRTRFRRLDGILAIDRHHPHRKSYLRLDVAAHDDRLIRDRFGIPFVASNKILRKGLNVLTRLAGLSKLALARRGSDLLPLDTPPLAVIAIRQVATLRRWMPPGAD